LYIYIFIITLRKYHWTVQSSADVNLLPDGEAAVYYCAFDRIL